PFPWRGDSPYASILSSANKYYTHFGSHFAEFDPAKGDFTFLQETMPQMAMMMTEDDAGRIWSATYPNCGLVCFDPSSRQLTDYGYLNKENWAQYPRYLAADSAGWVYIGVGSTNAQIIAFDPATKKAFPVLQPAERAHGYGELFRGVDGKVYGRAPTSKEWFALFRGERTPVGESVKVAAKQYIAGSQGLSHRSFPDGRKLKSIDLERRALVVTSADGKQDKEVKFDYTSEGAHVMAVAAAPNGTVCGGTAFPFYFFSYDPKTDKWINVPCFGQWNTVARLGDKFYVGGYGGGFLLEWDPAKPWVPTQPDKADSNPRFLTEAEPDINRPHDLLACPDGRTLVLAGTPGYGYTGGGLLIWDTQAGTSTLLKHTELLEWQSTMSLTAIGDGLIVGGTTIAAGTGGEVKAQQPELYIFDLTQKKIVWHEPVLGAVGSYTDLCTGPDGLVYGFAGGRIFFVFDPKRRQVIHQKDVGSTLGSCSGGQGPRVFVKTPDGRIFVLMGKGFAQLDTGSFELTMVAEAPGGITVGGDYLDGRIYYVSGSHICSWKVPG
ncbi:MAG: hypothetical protein H5T86_09405, partial [Armatimonadetes bacterium]|nr:hypothetical protein [Armatimonadota bacterium]